MPKRACPLTCKGTEDTSHWQVVDLTVNLSTPAEYSEIIAALRAASEGELKGILGITEDEVTSAKQHVVGVQTACH